jgi:hypothetical protein
VKVAADGSYAFNEIEAATHLLEVWPASVGDYAGIGLAPTFPLSLEANAPTTLDLVWLAPEQHVSVPDSSTELEIADGLLVTLGHDTALPSFLLSGDFTEVYGVRYPDDKRPPIAGVSDPLGLWVLGPTETSSTGDGFPVRFTNDWALADGTVLHVWYSAQDQDTLAGRWLSAGDVTVAGSDISGDAKLPNLGTVLLSK